MPRPTRLARQGGRVNFALNSAQTRKSCRRLVCTPLRSRAFGRLYCLPRPQEKALPKGWHDGEENHRKHADDGDNQPNNLDSLSMFPDEHIKAIKDVPQLFYQTFERR